jgi:hypothetical protein
VLHHAGLRNTYQHIRQGVFAVEAEAAASQQTIPRLSSQPGNLPHQTSLPDLSRPSPALVQTIQQLCQHPPTGAPLEPTTTRY